MAGVWSWAERVAKGEVSGPPAAAWRCVMWPLSWLYRGAVAGHRLRYRRDLVGIPKDRLVEMFRKVPAPV